MQRSGQQQFEHRIAEHVGILAVVEAEPKILRPPPAQRPISVLAGEGEPTVSPPEQVPLPVVDQGGEPSAQED